VAAAVNALEAACARHGVTLNAAALQFAQAHPAVTTLVVGAVSPAEIDANLTALHVPIPEALWTELVAAGQIDPAAPRPSLEKG
jgi:D-threo-aldose 1-dehydrogenase